MQRRERTGDGVGHVRLIPLARGTERAGVALLARGLGAQADGDGGQPAEHSANAFVCWIERTARRDLGYCWYGETIYEVGNLEEIVTAPEFEVYGEN